MDFIVELCNLKGELLYESQHHTCFTYFFFFSCVIFPSNFFWFVFQFVFQLVVESISQLLISILQNMHSIVCMCYDEWFQRKKQILIIFIFLFVFCCVSVIYRKYVVVVVIFLVRCSRCL